MFVYAYMSWCDASRICIKNQQGEDSKQLKKAIQACWYQMGILSRVGFISKRNAEFVIFHNFAPNIDGKDGDHA